MTVLCTSCVLRFVCDEYWFAPISFPLENKKKCQTHTHSQTSGGLKWINGKGSELRAGQFFLHSFSVTVAKKKTAKLRCNGFFFILLLFSLYKNVTFDKEEVFLQHIQLLPSKWFRAAPRSPNALDFTEVRREKVVYEKPDEKSAWWSCKCSQKEGITYVMVWHITAKISCWRGVRVHTAGEKDKQKSPLNWKM